MQTLQQLQDGPRGKVVTARVRLTFEDLATPPSLDEDIPKGAVLLSHHRYVRTAFDGGATLTIGDGTTVDKFLAAGDTDLTTVGDYVANSKGAQQLDVATPCVFTLGGAPTAGEVDVTLVFALAGV